MRSLKTGPLGIGGAQTMAKVWAGGLTSPFTVLSSMGSPCMLATSVNGRDQDSSGWMQLFQTSVTLIVTSKLEKGRGVPQVLSLSFPLNETKQNIPYTSPAIHGLTQEPVQTHGPILCLLLWTKLFYISAESEDHVGQENGWL